jgi:polar amino acid transport system substrate-binding protein
MILSLLLAFAAGALVAPTQAAGLKILTAENPPLNFSRDGEITGLATEVVRELRKRTGTGGNIRLVAWQEGYRTLSEQPDVALFSTVMTAERKPLFQWVGPLVVQDTNLYALKGSAIKIANLDEARKVNKIATVSKYYSEQMLKAEGFANTQSYPDRETTLRKLLDGTVQLLASSNTEMPAALEKTGVSVDDLRNVFTVSTDLVYIAFSKEISPELVARWQDALDAMKRDGSFARIYARWLPAETPPAYSSS